MGTASQHAVWKDELKGVLARLGLHFGDINEEPPEKPEGWALTRVSYQLWLDAVEQYQIEGTALFDAVRPSLPLTGAYTQMDVRAISQMKSDTSAVKDGRALLRWALDFVNKSSLSCQMQLLEELNKKKISSQADMLQFSDHMIALYEMWLQKEGSKVHEPAEYYQRLLASIPFENEGPLARWPGPTPIGPRPHYQRRAQRP